MSETVIKIFNEEEVSVLSEFEKEVFEMAQGLPKEVSIDKERMGECLDE